MSDIVRAEGHALGAKQLLALVGYTLREARHKWTMMAIFVLTTLLLLLLATLVNVDVVEGVILAARLFGTVEVPLGDQRIPVTDAVTVIQTIITTTLSTIGLVLALFITGNILPRTLETGWVDLLVAQPMRRALLVIGRTLGAVVVVTLGLGYLFGGAWAILAWKTGFGNAGFLLAGVVILFTFLSCYAGMVLVGVITRNSPISIIAGIGLWGVGLILYPLHRYEEWTTAFRAGWQRSTVSALAEALYWVLPKTAELTARAVEAAQRESFDLSPVWASLPFAIACLAVASWWFSRQDY